MSPEEKTIVKNEKSGGHGMGEDKLSLRNIAQIVYICQALSFFFGITSIIGIIINYVKRDAVKGTWLESHFTWQIRTFWYSLGLSLIGFLLMFVIIGFLILAAVFIWSIYRVVKGWLLLNEGKPIENSLDLI
jgi:uncharacterized membrane protein